MSAITPFPQLLHAFFYDWLIEQRNTPHHTIVAYRDSWRRCAASLPSPPTANR